MRRREFIILCGSATVTSPFVARAQLAGGVRRIGYLSGGTEEAQRPFVAAFKQGMRNKGYVDDQDFSIVACYADGKFERLPSLVRELLGLNPDVLLVSTTPANLAAKAATSTIPIVMVGVADPIGVGLIASLAQP